MHSAATGEKSLSNLRSLASRKMASPPSPATSAISPNANEAKTLCVWLMRKSCAARKGGGLFLRTPPSALPLQTWMAGSSPRISSTRRCWVTPRMSCSNLLSSISLHEEDVEENRTLIGELLDEKRQQVQIEKQYRRKDGQPVWVRNNVSVVPGTERVPRFLMAISEDVTHRKLSEEALARARSELAKVARITSLGVLTASIAHEINQPLSGIITNASTCLRMLSADPPNVDGARETVRRTIRDGNRVSDVITRLRTLYSRKEPSLESMDLNEATREVTAVSLSELQRSGVMLRYELADDLPPVVGGPRPASAGHPELASKRRGRNGHN